jgi:acetyl esterase/lipase
MWVIPVDVPPSEFVKEEVSELVRKVITKLGPINKLEVTVANIAGEWQGEKSSPDLGSSLLSEQQQFDRLTNDAMSEAVILYFHGGAYVVASPDVLRPTTRRLARDCGGRVFSVRYRLAPQQPFPAALIDAVMAYKYLIDPPAGAMHSPIDPGKIVFAGDSAGVQSL